jgi:hypothetical protein
MTGITETREHDIKALAETVADLHFPDRRVEPEELLRTKRITFNYGRYGDAFDGMLECESGAFHVYCNLDRVTHRGSPRARFTLGHELGHYFIDEHRRALKAGRVDAHPSSCDFESKLRAEREADLFATNLLMPEARFRKMAKRAPSGIAGVIDLAEVFGTSITSAAIRYVKTDLFPCAVIKWNPERYAWRWISQQMYDDGLGGTLSSIEDIPRGSATERALSGNPAPREGYFQSGGTASFWVPRKLLRAGDPILVEEAVPLGRFGALTLLYPDQA